MKFIAFAAVAAAFVIPDMRMLNQLVLDDAKKPSHLHEAVKAGVDKGIETVNSWFREGLARAEELFEAKTDSDADADDALFCNGPEGCPNFFSDSKDKFSNLTIYQLISESNYTTKFAALVNKYDDLVSLLNSTDANYTLFVPVDAAFEKLPGGQLNESDALESIVRYHIGLDAYPYKRIFATHTIPTAYNESLLGGQPQRLRARFEKHLGLRVNFYSRVVAPNFGAKNGVIHAVDSVIAPPTYAGRELSLVPAHFSTLLLAMDKTDFSQYVNDVDMTGATLFAPSNVAFDQLGPRLNAFLFNTPKGLKYLAALLKYSVVPNNTLYSDAFYGAATVAAPDAETSMGGLIERRVYELPTLLGNATVSVNVTDVPGYIFMLVNGAVRVSVQDGVAKDGVIQEVSRLVFPPFPKHNHTEGEPGNPWKEHAILTEEDVIARLAPYVDDAESTDGAPVNEL